MAILLYTATITVAVIPGTEEEIEKQLDSIILPPSSELCWTLKGLKPFETTDITSEIKD